MNLSNIQMPVKLKFFPIVLLVILNLSFVSWTKPEIITGSVTKSDCYVYVSVNKGKKIAIFKLDPIKESLIPGGEVNLNGEPGSLCIDPLHKKMYAGLRDLKSVASLSIDQNSGRLTQLKDTPVADNPVYISTDKKGKFLFFTSYSGSMSAVYPIEREGVNKDAIQVVDAHLNPHMIKTDASGKFVFVSNKGGDFVQQFIFQNDGSLKPNNPKEIAFKSKTGPRHFTFNPSGDILYVVTEIACTVMAFHFDKKTGTLNGPFQEITTKPSDFTSSNTCADIHITSNGKFLYASNRGHDSLAGFSIEEETGKIKPIGWFATEKEPREFEIDPSGRFLIAAGESSGKIALYTIQKDGSLNLLKTYEVGHWPVWVTAAVF